MINGRASVEVRPQTVEKAPVSHQAKQGFTVYPGTNREST